jgi:hypothetical protein
MFVCVCVYVCMCVDICVCVYVFIQDPDPGSDPKLCEKSDPDPKKIIPDPQHCFILIQYGGRHKFILTGDRGGGHTYVSYIIYLPRFLTFLRRGKGVEIIFFSYPLFYFLGLQINFFS